MTNTVTVNAVALLTTTLTVLTLNFVTEIKMEDVYFAPSLFLNHGAGPYPVLGEKNNLEIGEALKNVSNYVDLSRLKAIVVVTAHREEDIVTISSAERHSLVYDYTNFPPECYKYQYNAPGDPVLAARIHEAFKTAGIKSRLDDQRGWDHGVFIPMMLVNPKADIPIIQISILKNQNAVQHYEIGRVLYQFRKEGVAIFGSGFSYHNEEGFERAKGDNDKRIENTDFDTFLNEVCTGDEENRKKIVFWEQEKGGYDSHPLGEADHLMPLIVNAGAGGTERGRNIFKSVYADKFKISGFIWD